MSRYYEILNKVELRWEGWSIHWNEPTKRQKNRHKVKRNGRRFSCPSTCFPISLKGSPSSLPDQAEADADAGNSEPWALLPPGALPASAGFLGLTRIVLVHYLARTVWTPDPPAGGPDLRTGAPR
jgi:hypothetical protein